jgi:putative ABC transport system permease protein
MIGVGLVGFITIFASSTKASISHAIDTAFTGDYVIDSGGGMAGGVDPGLATKLNGLREVKAATGLRLGMAKVNGSVRAIGAVDPATAFQLMDVKPEQGSPGNLGVDGIAVYRQVAKDKHLKLGDTVPVVFKDTGAKQLRIVLIYGQNQPVGDYFLGTAAYDANFASRYDAMVFIKKAPGTMAAAGMAAVKGVLNDYPGAKVLDQTGLKQEQAKGVNQLLYLVYALLGLAIVIALLGIGNTLALWIFERTREYGLMRAVGMTRAQLGSSIRWESVIIALQGTTLGLLIGLFFGWAFVRALRDRGISVFRVPFTALVVVVVLAALAGVVAAILPSRRAAKLDILRAVVSD